MLPPDPELTAVRPALRPVLTYARKLNDHPDQVAQADVDATPEAGWDESAVAYAVGVSRRINSPENDDPALIEEVS